MCGIVGVFHLDGAPVEQPLLERMAATLSHRGPDGQKTGMPAASVGLGHTRLKVIDLSNQADQPMSNEDGSITLVFNGEIYNYQELKAGLQQRGVRFATSSDTEVILRLYEVAGISCIQSLDGMFALGIWDNRRRHLVLARDRVGKKPLFYYSGSSLFALDRKSVV